MWPWTARDLPAWASISEPSQPGQWLWSHPCPLGLSFPFCTMFRLPDGETLVQRPHWGPWVGCGGALGSDDLGRGLSWLQRVLSFSTGQFLITN